MVKKESDILFAPGFLKLFYVLKGNNIHKASRIANITPSHAYNIINVCVDKKLLTRKRVGRETKITLTPEGERFFKVVSLLKNEFKNIGVEW